MGFPAGAAPCHEPGVFDLSKRLKLHKKFRSPEDRDRAEEPCDPPSEGREVAALAIASPGAVSLTSKSSLPPFPHPFPRHVTAQWPHSLK